MDPGSTADVHSSQKMEASPGAADAAAPAGAGRAEPAPDCSFDHFGHTPPVKVKHVPLKLAQ